jgi:Immunity protein 53
MIKWLQQWYADNCNGEWEHSYGVAIGTINKPGWAVSIDLTNTILEGVKVPDHFQEKSANDWMGYSVVENVFEGVGDPSKLERIIEVFKEIAEANQKAKN